MLKELIDNAIELFKVETGKEPKVIRLSVEDVFGLPVKKSILGRLVYIHKGVNYPVKASKSIESGDFYVQ